MTSKDFRFCFLTSSSLPIRDLVSGTSNWQKWTSHTCLLNEPDHSDEKGFLCSFGPLGLPFAKLPVASQADKFMAPVYVFLTHRLQLNTCGCTYKRWPKDPSILASTSGLKGTNQSFHHIPSGTHWWRQHLKNPAGAICHHVDTRRPQTKVGFELVWMTSLYVQTTMVTFSL